MKIICSWCGKKMGEKEPLSDPSVTNGMCRPCLGRMARRIGFSEEEIQKAWPEEEDTIEEMRSCASC
jgi:hypothetical protein